MERKQPSDKSEGDKEEEEGVEPVAEKQQQQQQKDRREEERKLLAVELEHLQQERYDHHQSYESFLYLSFVPFRAVLTASLPKLEPFSPMEGTPLEFPSPSAYSIHYNKKPPTQSDVRGTGMDEFLKRQSMFAGQTQAPEHPEVALAKKRLSHTTYTPTPSNHDTTTSSRQKKEQTKETENELLPGVCVARYICSLFYS